MNAPRAQAMINIVERLRILNTMSNEMVLAIYVLISIVLFIMYVTILHRVLVP